MASCPTLPTPTLDALPLGAHRAVFGMLTDEALFAACGVRIAFTSRAGGVSGGAYAQLNLSGSVGDDPRAVRENRRRVLQALGAANVPLVSLSQVHGTRLLHVGHGVADVRAATDRSGFAVDGEEGIASALNNGLDRVSPCAGMPAPPEEADGIVVECDGVAALIMAADCLTLILVAPGGQFAVVHAGWRGAIAGIASKAARSLARVALCEPRQLNAYIGPHIRGECFEVGVDVEQRFRSVFGAVAIAGARHVSLAGAVACDLQSAGIDPARIADSGICTKCRSDEYFSYRASDGMCGRHAAIAVRV